MFRILDPRLGRFSANYDVLGGFLIWNFYDVKIYFRTYYYQPSFFLSSAIWASVFFLIRTKLKYFYSFSPTTTDLKIICKTVKSLFALFSMKWTNYFFSGIKFFHFCNFKNAWWNINTGFPWLAKSGKILSALQKWNLSLLVNYSLKKK